MPEPTAWKVLVVEDRAGISASLLGSRPDFEIRAVHRLQAADRLLRETLPVPFQAVLLDLSLADLADPMGVDTYRRLRAMAPGLPVVVLVPAHAEEAPMALAAEGAFACLPRQSSTVEVLAWTLRQAILRSRVEARRYKDLFDAVPIGILLASGRRVAMANPAALVHLGYGADELARLSVLDLFPATMRASLESALDATGAGEAREATFAAALIRKDGTPAAATVTLKGALLHDAPALALYLEFLPAPASLVPVDPGASGNLSETYLPGVPGAESAPIPQGHPQERLAALGRMAASIAHDFNNLFTAINGYSDHLLGLPGAEGTMERGLKAIRKAGEAAAAMTRGLLSFSHPGSGEPGPVKVDKALDEAAPALAEMLGGALRLRIRPGCGNAAALLEAGQLEQILFGLAQNAREAMPAGGAFHLATESVEAAPGDAAFSHLAPRTRGPFAVLTAADNGKGMGPDVMARLFEPNFSTKSGPKGQGFGLAGIYGMVSSVGGGLQVESRPGQGSVFKIWLPMAGVAAAVTSYPGYPAAAEPPATEVLGEDTVADEPPRVLVVEDEPSLRDMLRAVLERYGFEVEEAVSGGDAEEVVESLERWPDLIVSDVLLRDGLGTETVARLRARRPSLRVLFISGHSLETLADQGIHIAADEFLEKPFTPSQLGNRAKAALARDGKVA